MFDIRTRARDRTGAPTLLVGARTGKVILGEFFPVRLSGEDVFGFGDGDLTGGRDRLTFDDLRRCVCRFGFDERGCDDVDACEEVVSESHILTVCHVRSSSD